MGIKFDKILNELRERDTASDPSNPPDLSNYYTKGEVDNLFEDFGTDATQSASGLMSAADKAKLDGLGENATQSASGLMSAADKAKLDAVSVGVNPINYLKLPGNLIFQWGTYSLSSDPDSREITLPVTVTATYGRFASSSNSAVKLGIDWAAAGQISISASGANSGVVYWMVIGKVE